MSDLSDVLFGDLIYSGLEDEQDLLAVYEDTIPVDFSDYNGGRKEFETVSIPVINFSLDRERSYIEPEFMDEVEFATQDVWEGRTDPYTLEDIDVPAEVCAESANPHVPMKKRSGDKKMKKLIKAPLFSIINLAANSIPMEKKMRVLILGCGDGQDIYRVAKSMNFKRQFEADIWDPAKVELYRNYRSISKMESNVSGRDWIGIPFEDVDLKGHYDLVLWAFSFHYFVRDTPEAFAPILKHTSAETHFIGNFPSETGLATISADVGKTGLHNDHTLGLQYAAGKGNKRVMGTVICGAPFKEPSVTSEEIFGCTQKHGLNFSVLHARSLPACLPVANKFRSDCIHPYNRGFLVAYAGPLRLNAENSLPLPEEKLYHYQDIFQSTLHGEFDPEFPMNKGRPTVPEDLIHVLRSVDMHLSEKTDGRLGLGVNIRKQCKIVDMEGNLYKFPTTLTKRLEFQCEIVRRNDAVEFVFIDAFTFDGHEAVNWRESQAIGSLIQKHKIFSYKEWIPIDDVERVKNLIDNAGEGVVVQNDSAPPPQRKRVAVKGAHVQSWIGFARYVKRVQTLDLRVESRSEIGETDACRFKDPNDIFTGPGIYEMTTDHRLIKARLDKDQENSTDYIERALRAVPYQEFADIILDRNAIATPPTVVFSESDAEWLLSAHVDHENATFKRLVASYPGEILVGSFAPNNKVSTRSNPRFVRSKFNVDQLYTWRRKWFDRSLAAGQYSM